MLLSLSNILTLQNMRRGRIKRSCEATKFGFKLRREICEKRRLRWGRKVSRSRIFQQLSGDLFENLMKSSWVLSRCTTIKLRFPPKTLPNLKHSYPENNKHFPLSFITVVDANCTQKKIILPCDNYWFSSRKFHAAHFQLRQLSQLIKFAFFGCWNLL